MGENINNENERLFLNISYTDFKQIFHLKSDTSIFILFGQYNFVNIGQIVSTINWQLKFSFVYPK